MSHIDPSALEMLRELSPEDPGGFVKKIVDVFIAQSRQDVMTLQKALDDGNAGEIMKIAHKLKSGARSVGAMELGDLSEALEGAAKASASFDEVRTAATRVLDSYAVSEAELLKLIAG